MGGTHVIIKEVSSPRRFSIWSLKERVTFACMPADMINIALNHRWNAEARERCREACGSGRPAQPRRSQRIQSAQESSDGE